MRFCKWCSWIILSLQLWASIYPFKITLDASSHMLLINVMIFSRLSYFLHLTLVNDCYKYILVYMYLHNCHGDSQFESFYCFCRCGTTKDTLGPMLCEKLHSIGWLVAHIAIVRNEVRHDRSSTNVLLFCNKSSGYRILLFPSDSCSFVFVI